MDGWKSCSFILGSFFCVFSGANCLGFGSVVDSIYIPSSKLTWQWKFTFSNRKYIFKWWIFHSYVSLPEGIYIYIFFLMAFPILFPTSRQLPVPGETAWTSFGATFTGISMESRCFVVVFGESLRGMKMDIWTYIGVSKKRGTPKWMVYNGKPYYNGWFGGTIMFGNIHMYINIYERSYVILT